MLGKIMKSSKNPIKSGKNPVKSGKNPVKTIDAENRIFNPIRSLRNSEEKICQ